MTPDFWEFEEFSVAFAAIEIDEPLEWFVIEGPQHSTHIEIVRDFLVLE